MPVELSPEQYYKAFKLLDDPIDDILMSFDLSKEKKKRVKAFMNKEGVLVIWNDSDVLMKAKTRSSAQDLLKAVPKDSKYAFLVSLPFSGLVREKFDRKEEVLCVNYVTRGTFKPVKVKEYEVVPLSIEHTSEIAKIWPYAKGNVTALDFVEKWPAYAIMDKGSPVSWGGLYLEDEHAAFTGMWYTRPGKKYRNKGMMKHIVSQIASDITGKGKILRADIRTDNIPSLKVANSLGFMPHNFYSRLEPVV